MEICVISGIDRKNYARHFDQKNAYICYGRTKKAAGYFGYQTMHNEIQAVSFWSVIGWEKKWDGYEI